ncbi:MAG: hypothetical protein FWG39_04295, partial [Alphaproteobacteria bacterium]|nr:hypothetical protein [Alphaproteobacteria bacterium]
MVLIQYLNADDAVYETAAVRPGYPVNPPSVLPMKAGHYLSHWHDNAEPAEKPFIFGTPVPSAGITLRPVFGEECYVLFISAGTQVTPQV